MSTITVRFDRVHAQRLGVNTFCTKCKKKLKRTVREEETLNPWNTIVVEGVKRPCTRKEIFDRCEEKVKHRVADLQANGTICMNCED